MKGSLLLIYLGKLFPDIPDLTLDIINIHHEFLLLGINLFLSSVLLGQIALSGHFQHLCCPSQVNGTVPCSLITCHIILQFTDQILSCNAFQLRHGYCIIIYSLTYISQYSFQASLLHICQFLAVFIQQFPHQMLLLEIPCKPVIVSLALKPHDPAVHSRILPWFIGAVYIISGCFSPHSGKTEKHALYESMYCGLSTFILTVEYIDPRRKL